MASRPVPLIHLRCTEEAAKQFSAALDRAACALEAQCDGPPFGGRERQDLDTASWLRWGMNRLEERSRS